MPNSVSQPAHDFDDLRYHNKIMKSTKSFAKILVGVGVRLAELREKKGYETLKEFTQRYDLPQIQYWRIEKGKANMTLKTLVKILAIHNITLQDFFCLVMEEEIN